MKLPVYRNVEPIDVEPERCGGVPVEGVSQRWKVVFCWYVIFSPIYFDDFYNWLENI